jgi:2-oxoglutarate ferredoxin oxidoreductase subunit beta
LEDKGWDPSDFHKSAEKAFEWGDSIPLGVIYKTVQPTYEDSEPIFKKGALVKQPLEIDKKTFAELVHEWV